MPGAIRKGENMKEKVLELIKAKGLDVEITSKQRNNVIKEGIIFKNDSPAPIIYFPSNMDEMNEEEVAEKILDMYKDAKNSKINFDPEMLKNGKIKPCVCNTAINKDFLNTVIHKDLPFGLSVYYRIWLNNEVSTVITPQILKYLNLTNNDVFKYKDKYSVKKLIEFIEENLGFPCPIPADAEQPPVYIVYNDNCNFAAAVLSDDTALKGISDIFEGNDFYILPSSVHEVLVCEKSSFMNPRELQDIVMSINSTELRPEDFLSDDIFVYHQGMISVA